jgi:hypothetical protein
MSVSSPKLQHNKSMMIGTMPKGLGFLGFLRVYSFKKFIQLKFDNLLENFANIFSITKK